MIPQDLALRIVEVWLTTEFEGGRHLARIRKIEGG
jgi:ribose 5-phosphate isomerase B